MTTDKVVHGHLLHEQAAGRALPFSPSSFRLGLSPLDAARRDAAETLDVIKDNPILEPLRRQLLYRFLDKMLAEPSPPSHAHQGTAPANDAYVQNESSFPTKELAPKEPSPEVLYMGEFVRLLLEGMEDGLDSRLMQIRQFRTKWLERTSACRRAPNGIDAEEACNS